MSRNGIQMKIGMNLLKKKYALLFKSFCTNGFNLSFTFLGTFVNLEFVVPCCAFFIMGPVIKIGLQNNFRKIPHALKFLIKHSIIVCLLICLVLHGDAKQCLHSIPF